MTGHPVALTAGRVATPDVVHELGWVLLDDDRVVSVGDGAPAPGFPVVDLGDRVVAPGFVDVHVHGGGGAQVNGDNVAEVTDAVHHLARFHARHGTTALLATTVSDDSSRLLTAVRGTASARRHQPPDAARILGAHLEGPWISPARAGAQNPAALRDPDVRELAGLVEAGGGDVVRLLTLAPELPNALDLTTAAIGAGVTVAVGHTEADYATTRRAFDAGARHVTHLFNTMPPAHHRRPGPVVAALTDPRVTVEVITDGHHVHPAVLAATAMAAGDRLVAVTDATAAAGLPEGEHRLGDLAVVVEGGRVTLAADRDTLAGSALTLDRAVALLVREAGLSVTAAVTAATATPARGAGAPGTDVPGRGVLRARSVMSCRTRVRTPTRAPLRFRARCHLRRGHTVDRFRGGQAFRTLGERGHRELRRLLQRRLDNG